MRCGACYFSFTIQPPGGKCDIEGLIQHYEELRVQQYAVLIPPAGAAPVTVTVSTPDRRPTFFVCNTLEDDTEGRGATAAGDLERSRRSGWA